MVKLNVGIFGKDNTRKRSKDNPRSIGAKADGRTRADDPVTRTDTDAKADNSGTITDNSGIEADNSSIAAENLGTTTDNPGIAANNPGIAADNLDTKTVADAGVNNLAIVASNKACAAFFFALRRAFFCLLFPLNQ